MTIAVTWPGVIPSAFRMAMSRTRSRVVRSRVLKTPRPAIAPRINARAATIASRMASMLKPVPELIACGNRKSGCAAETCLTYASTFVPGRS